MPNAGVSPLLPPVLRVFGVVFVVGVPVLNRIWPTGWAWQPEQPAYLHMIWSIYMTLGVFLIIASYHPERHLSLIWFTIWSSVAHPTTMAVHSVTDPGQIGHLWGDVAALYVTAVVLWAFLRRAGPAGPATATS